MKKYLLLFLSAFIMNMAWSQVKIGGAGAPNSSAVLDLESTTRGLLAPRLTMAQRNAIPSPATGLLVYQTDNTPGFYYYNGIIWTSISSAATDLALPFSKSQPSAGSPLFYLNNTAAANVDGAIHGASASTSSNAAAIKGILSTTTPGSFSAAIRGINNGIGGLGIGIWGSHDGSGWGVYGVSATGIGTYGNSPAGIGVYANSENGTGLTATSANGNPASFEIYTNTNTNHVLNVNTVSTGRGINVNSDGGTAIHATTSYLGGGAVIGRNYAGGEAIIGFTTSDIAGAVVGRNDGGGYGVRGFISGNTDATGAGIFGQVGINGSKGRAGRFENILNTNIEANALEVETNGNGNIPNNKLGNAASFVVNNPNSVAAAVRGEVNSIFGNFGATAILGISSGTGGRAGSFYASNVSGNGDALLALTDGNGNAITANAGKNGDGVETTADGNGNALHAWVPAFGTGRAGKFHIYNDANTNDVITVTTVGNGIAGNFKVDKLTGTSAAVRGEVTSQFSNFGTAGIFGISSGTGGFAGLFHASNPSGNGPALIAIADGNGNGITANATNTGDGIEATADGTGTSVYGWTPSFSQGRAARFVNWNDANTNPVLTVETHSSGNLAIFKAGDPATANVARINAAGKGFFNGGTQLGGADVAEYFDVEGEKSQYEAGDVLVISQSTDRTIEKSSAAYSTLVAGVYATQPGVLLTEKNAEADQVDDMVPMGVIGVIPTKVCLEGGPVKRGDLLVTSSIPGVAMKADIEKVKPGQVIGKALQEYNGHTIGKIKVLVNIK